MDSVATDDGDNKISIFIPKIDFKTKFLTVSEAIGVLKNNNSLMRMYIKSIQDKPAIKKAYEESAKFQTSLEKDYVAHQSIEFNPETARKFTNAMCDMIDKNSYDEDKQWRMIKCDVARNIVKDLEHDITLHQLDLPLIVHNAFLNIYTIKDLDAI